jgi:hypothetical protein
MSIPLSWFRFLSLSLVVSVHSLSMCSVVSDTPQKEHSGDGVFSMTCLCIARVYPVLSLDTTTCSLLLRLVESYFHSIFSFLNLIVFSPCAHLFYLFFASVFFIQLIRSCGGYSSRSLMSSSNAFFAAPSLLSGSVSTSSWPFPILGQVARLFVSSLGFFVHLVPSTAIIVLRESVAITVSHLPLVI